MPLAGGLGSSNGNMAYGVAFRLYDQFSGPAAAIQAAMQGLTGSTNRMGRGVKQAVDIAGMGFAIGVIQQFTGAITGLFTGIIEKAGSYEMLTNAMGAMLKSATAGKTLMDSMDKFAAETPFNITPVREAGRMLIAFGEKAEGVVPTLKMLGNVAAGVGIDIREMAEVYGRNLQLPHLYMRDIWQMATRGVPIIQALTSILHINAAELQDYVQKGKVTVDHMRQAFVMMGSGTGIFANQMEILSKTLPGSWSNIQDAVYLAAQSWGNSLLPALKAIIPLISKLVYGFKAFAESGIGKAILIVVTAMLALLLVGGLLAIAAMSLKLSLMGLTSLLPVLVKENVMLALSEKRLAAAFRLTAAAAWASLRPYLPIAVAIAAVAGVLYGLYKALNEGGPVMMTFGAVLLFALGPIGWVIGAVAFLKRSMTEFSNMSEVGPNQNGILGFMQRLGGVLTGLIELWRNWDDLTQTSSLSMSTYNKLNSLGILQSVMNIVTYIQRIKTSFAAFKSEFIRLFTSIKKGILGFLRVFVPAGSALDKFIFGIEGSTSSIERWKHAGRIAAKILIAGIITLGIVIAVMTAIATASFISMAIAVAAATWEFVLIIVAVALLIYAFYKLDEWWKKARWAILGWAGDVIMQIANWIADLPDRMIAAGRNMIVNLVMGMLQALPILKATLSMLGEAYPILKLAAWAIPDMDPSGTTPTPAYAGARASAMQGLVDNSTGKVKASPWRDTAGTPVSSGGKKQPIEITIKNELGGKALTDYVHRIDLDDDDRGNE